MTKKEPKIKIFVSHHKPWYIYEDDIYIPIQVGKKNAKIDLWIIWDDTGDNISDKNSNYAELTAQYRVWKNYDLSDVDYIWFCHYRRYLDFWITIKFNDIKNIIHKCQWLYKIICNLFDYVFQFARRKVIYNNKLLWYYSGNTKKYIQKKDIDIITYRTSIWIRRDNMFHFQLSNKELYSILEKIITDKYPDYVDSIDETQKLRHVNYCNIFIMNKKTFLEYSEWLFTILLEYERVLENKWLIKLWLNEPLTADTRFFWCLSERLFNIFMTYKKINGARIEKSATLVSLDIQK